MRDLWVDIPGYGAAKVNAGLELGGVPLMTQTVEALLGQHIDHTVMLDFQGFAAMTDALGGVDVDIKQAFQGTIDDYVYFPAGREPAQRAAGAGLCPRAPRLRRRRLPAGPEPADLPQGRDGQDGGRRRAVGPEHREAAGGDRPPARHGVPGADPGDAGTASPSACAARPRATACSSPFPPPASDHRDGQSIILQNPAATAAVSAALASGTLGEYVAANGLQNGN